MSLFPCHYCKTHPCECTEDTVTLTKRGTVGSSQSSGMDRQSNASEAPLEDRSLRESPQNGPIHFPLVQTTNQNANVEEEIARVTKEINPNNVEEAINRVTKELIPNNTKLSQSYLSPATLGASPKQLYIKFLQDLYFVYGALEEELVKESGKTIPWDKLLFKDELFRTDAIGKDLAFFCGPEWKSLLTPSRATNSYTSRIKEIGKTDPDLLLAHHSIRYMGDLQACDALKKRIQRFFNLDGDAGVEFHTFKLINDKQAFVKSYYATIQGFGVEPDLKKRLMEETRTAYQLNLNIYWELTHAGDGDDGNSNSAKNILLSLAFLVVLFLAVGVFIWHHKKAPEPIPIQQGCKILKAPDSQWEYIMNMLKELNCNIRSKLGY